jgi:predicted transcriptional regulator
LIIGEIIPIDDISCFFVLTFKKVSQNLLDSCNLLQRFYLSEDRSNSRMRLKEILDALNADLLTEDADLEKEIECAFGSDLISDTLMCVKEPTLLLTGLTNPQVIRLSDMIDLLGVVFVRGKIPSQEIIDMARERELPLISTKNTMYKSSGILYNKGLRSCKI